VGTSTPWGQLSASSTSATPTLAVEQKSTGPAAIFLGGKVGIATTSPASTFTVVGSACVSGGAGATAPCGITAGHISAVAHDTAAVDLAENYKTQDQTITAGDVVAIDANNDESIIKATPNSLVVGIVSTKPGVLLGLSDDETVRPVALVGRVPVKVNSENGNINRGDKLTISSIAGVATKFNGIGPVVGIALNQPEAGLVLAFVQTGLVQETNNFINSTLISAPVDHAVLPILSDLISGVEKWMYQRFSATAGFFKEIFAELITTNNLKAKNATVDNGLTVKDQKTGLYYCLGVVDGVMKNLPGTCEEQVLVPDTASVSLPIIEPALPIASTTDETNIITDQEAVVNLVPPIVNPDPLKSDPIKETDPELNLPIKDVETTTL
jgi:hypothetical protein